MKTHTETGAGLTPRITDQEVEGDLLRVVLRENAELRAALAESLTWMDILRRLTTVDESGPLCTSIAKARAALNSRP